MDWHVQGRFSLHQIQPELLQKPLQSNQGEDPVWWSRSPGRPTTRGAEVVALASHCQAGPSEPAWGRADSGQFTPDWVSQEPPALPTQDAPR